MKILDNFTNPLDQFNFTNMQIQQHNYMSSLTNHRKLGNKYHQKLVQLMDGQAVIDKLLSRVIDNPKYAVREAADVAE